MSIPARCPNPQCGTLLSVPADGLGRPNRCPRCGTVFTLGPARVAAPLPATGPLETSTCPPTVIGRYRVREKLGSGAFGTVYRAYDPRLDREIALKVLRPEVLASKQAVQRFQREARTAAQMHHPHIVPVHDAGRHGELHFIASAFIPGRTLAAAIPEGGFDPGQAARLALQLAEALAYAHGRGVLHRDVKPANIMLGEQDTLYLTDFGLAGWTQQEGDRLTKVGAVMGTPAYMAPEQASGDPEQVGPAADLYSAGVVLYEMLTDRLPFAGPLEAVVYNVLHTPPTPPSHHRPGLDPRLEAICLKALAKKPQERFASGQDMAAALREWLQGQGPLPGLSVASPTLPQPLAVPTPRGPRPRGASPHRARKAGSQPAVEETLPASPGTATEPPGGTAARPERGRAARRGLLLGIAAGALLLAGLVVWLGGHRNKALTPDPNALLNPDQPALPVVPGVPAARATYRFAGTLAAEEKGVPALVPTDPMGQNGFETATVFGRTQRVYRFSGNANPATQQAGLTFDNSPGLLGKDNYSIEMVFLFLQNDNQYRRIVDVEDRQSDNGLYADPNNRLQIYPFPGDGNLIAAGTYRHLILTTANRGTVKAYLDGALQFTATTTSMNINNPRNVVHFFLDNTDGPSPFEFSDGKIALLRLYDGVLDDDQVSRLAVALRGAPAADLAAVKDAAPDPGTLDDPKYQPGQNYCFRVTGSETGAVWGTDVYTADSSLATAAVHAGVLRPGESGIIGVHLIPGLPAYAGSTRNGVTSNAWEDYPSAYTVARVGAAPPQPR